MSRTFEASKTQRLQRIEQRAHAIMLLREANERQWTKAYAAVRADADAWKMHRAVTGCCDSYTYGDVIA